MESISNEIFFRLRKSFPRFRRRPYSESSDLGFEQNIFSTALANCLDEKSLRQALFYAWILEDIPWDLSAPFGRVLDLGSKDFVYAPALAAILAKHFREFELTGLELDPYRTYYNFYRRGDAAKYYVEVSNKEFLGRAHVTYEQGDWLEWRPDQRYNLITSFFPFLYADLHSRFGLPISSFSPEAYYEKCFRSSDCVLFFHQGERELRDSLERIEKLQMGKVIFQKSYFENPWLARKFPVEVLLWQSFALKAPRSNS